MRLIAVIFAILLGVSASANCHHWASTVPQQFQEMEECFDREIKELSDKIDTIQAENAGMKAELERANFDKRVSDWTKKSVKPECCKHCKTGKACGDSCIAKWMNCTKPKGCACDVN